LVEGDGESAAEHKKFYNEYLSVMDLPAEFYLETIHAVFMDFALPKKKLKYRDRIVNPSAITRTGLMAIEGEKDDISGIGQTKAALSLCDNIPAERKFYHLQEGVGHYGSFHGRRFRQEIVPQIVAFTERVTQSQKGYKTTEKTEKTNVITKSTTIAVAPVVKKKSNEPVITKKPIKNPSTLAAPKRGRPPKKK
jgi:poly-beta-hydroxyalkanoate depolymerase